MAHGGNAGSAWKSGTASSTTGTISTRCAPCARATSPPWTAAISPPALLTCAACGARARRAACPPPARAGGGYGLCLPLYDQEAQAAFASARMWKARMSASALRPAGLGIAHPELCGDDAGAGGAQALSAASRAPACASAGSRRCVSWSGTMFEYLMPELFLRAPRGSLLEQIEPRGGAAAKGRLGERAGGARGACRESGYYAFDRASELPIPRVWLCAARHVGQRAGGRGRALRRGAGAALGSIGRLRKLCRRMSHLGWRGACGLYEAVDFRKGRLPEGAECAVVYSHMTHHQGMILAALTNALRADALVRLFFAQPRAQALSLLLEEKPAAPVRLRRAARGAGRAGAARGGEDRVHAAWRARGNRLAGRASALYGAGDATALVSSTPRLRALCARGRAGQPLVGRPAPPAAQGCTSTWQQRAARARFGQRPAGMPGLSLRQTRLASQAGGAQCDHARDGRGSSLRPGTPGSRPRTARSVQRRSACATARPARAGACDAAQRVSRGAAATATELAGRTRRFSALFRRQARARAKGALLVFTRRPRAPGASVPRPAARGGGPRAPFVRNGFGAPRRAGMARWAAPRPRAIALGHGGQRAQPVQRPADGISTLARRKDLDLRYRPVRAGAGSGFGSTGARALARPCARADLAQTQAVAALEHTGIGDAFTTPCSARRRFWWIGGFPGPGSAWSPRRCAICGRWAYAAICPSLRRTFPKKRDSIWRARPCGRTTFTTPWACGRICF